MHRLDDIFYARFLANHQPIRWLLQILPLRDRTIWRPGVKRVDTQESSSTGDEDPGVPIPILTCVSAEDHAYQTKKSRISRKPSKISVTNSSYPSVQPVRGRIASTKPSTPFVTIFVHGTRFQVRPSVVCSSTFMGSL